MRKEPMEITCEIYREGKFWIAEIPFLYATTQGTSLEDAMKMAEDLINTIVNDPKVKFEIIMQDPVLYSTHNRVRCTLYSNSFKLQTLFGTLLRRMRYLDTTSELIDTSTELR